MSEIEDAGEVLETEGELIAKEAQADSPFGGYGRPFSDDALGMSDAYTHDNPANNVGPYSGPNSYSINTVAPYQPPHGGEENPAQNVGPYNPPDPEAINAEGTPQEEAQETPEAEAAEHVRESYRSWNDRQWFDGSSTSIYNRAAEAEQLRSQAHLARSYGLVEELKEQIEILNKTAAEYDDSALYEAMGDVPGGTVALEYDDLVDGGLVDVTSFLSTGAYQIAREAAAYDWDSFKEEGARRWVAQKIADNPGLIKHEVMARQAAVDYARDKTMVLMDPARRADIIDAFVTSAERFRREAARRLLEDEEKGKDRTRWIEAAKTAQVEFDQAPQEFLPGSYTNLGPDYDEEGYLDIGEDDGTPLYEAARQSVESAKRDWSEFTTEGAREWFFAKVIDSPMAKHDDITYRAAKHYASDQAAGIPSADQRAEVVRAFSESVEFLRQAYLARESSRTAKAESEIDEFFDESDTLWF